MAHRNDLPDWIVEALQSLGGAGTIVEISRAIWDRHEDDLRESGDLFYTWQYDLRWGGLKLRKADVLLPASDEERGVWRLRAGRQRLYEGTTASSIASTDAVMGSL